MFIISTCQAATRRELGGCSASSCGFCRVKGRPSESRLHSLASGEHDLGGVTREFGLYSTLRV
jgi:hypothetical protein